MYHKRTTTKEYLKHGESMNKEQYLGKNFLANFIDSVIVYMVCSIMLSFDQEYFQTVK